MPKYASMNYVMESVNKNFTIIEGNDVRLPGTSRGMTPQILYNRDSVYVTLSRYVSVRENSQDGVGMVKLVKKPLDYAIAIDDPDKLKLVQKEIDKTQRPVFKKSRERASRDILSILGIDDDAYRKLIDCNPMLT